MGGDASYKDVSGETYYWPGQRCKRVQCSEMRRPKKPNRFDTMKFWRVCLSIILCHRGVRVTSPHSRDFATSATRFQPQKCANLPIKRHFQIYRLSSFLSEYTIFDEVTTFRGLTRICFSGEVTCRTDAGVAK